MPPPPPRAPLPPAPFEGHHCPPLPTKVPPTTVPPLFVSYTVAPRLNGDGPTCTSRYLTQVVDEFYIVFARWRLKNMAAQKPLGWEVEKGLESTASTSAAGAAGAAASNAGSNTGGVGGGLGSAASSVRGGSPPPAGPGASCRAPKQH